MNKLPHLERAHDEIYAAFGHVRSVTCLTLLNEVMTQIETLIRLEHDAHLREIRRLGT